MASRASAIGYYEEALPILRDLGDRREEGTALYNLADELWKVGERARAIEMMEESLHLHKEFEHPWLPKVRAQLAAWRDELGQP